MFVIIIVLLFQYEFPLICILRATLSSFSLSAVSTTKLLRVHKLTWDVSGKSTMSTASCNLSDACSSKYLLFCPSVSAVYLSSVVHYVLFIHLSLF